MVSDGQKIKAVWDENKGVLMGMVLGSLANMTVNIHWNHRPEVTQGLIVESSFTLPSIVANGVLKSGKCHITLKAANSESGSVLASQVAGWQASGTTFPSKPFSAFPRSRTPRLRGRAAHVAPAARRVVRAASGPRILLQDIYAMDIDQSAKGQPFGEDVKERIRRTTRVPSCAKGLKESSSASGSAGASQPDDGDDEEDDVDDGDEEQSLATRTTREKKAAYQVAAEAREARLLKFAMDEARKAEVASRAAEAKRRKHEHSLGRFTRCSSGHGPGVRIFAANPE